MDDREHARTVVVEGHSSDFDLQRVEASIHGPERGGARVLGRARGNGDVADQLCLRPAKERPERDPRATAERVEQRALERGERASACRAKPARRRPRRAASAAHRDRESAEIAAASALRTAACVSPFTAGKGAASPVPVRAVRERQRDQHVCRPLLRTRGNAERLVQFDVERDRRYVRDGNHSSTLAWLGRVEQPFSALVAGRGDRLLPSSTGSFATNGLPAAVHSSSKTDNGCAAQYPARRCPLRILLP